MRTAIAIRIIRPVIVGAGLLLLIACGGATGGEETTTGLDSLHLDLGAPAPATDAAQTAAATWKDFLATPHYLGRLAVRFQDGANVVYRDGQWQHRDGSAVAGLEQFGAQFPGTRVTRFLPDVSDEQLLQARAKAQAAGRNLHDWTQVFEVTTPDAATAEALLATLYSHPLVLWAHPESRPLGANISLPNIPQGPGQNYLSGAGSLNVIAGWNAGLTGAGQVVWDYEYDWNFSHEDLSVTPDGKTLSEVNQDAINHGTAVFGILGAQDNGIGVTGIVPTATLKPLRGGVGGTLAVGFLDLLYDNGGGKLIGDPRGKVVVIEQQLPGPKTPSQLPTTPDVSGTNCPGCLPAEGYRLEFEAIQDLVNAGVIVIEAAGNGAISLDDPSNIAQVCAGGCPNLASEDSGAVLVGASQGPNLKKLDASNSGKRVNTFAWGQGVVTTGYGDHPMSVAGNPNKAYTQQFGGTSAATAIIGGVAALVQEYAQKTVPHEAWQTVVFNSATIRALFTQAGVAQSDASGNIGKQPDVGTALSVITAGTVKPTLVTTDAFCAQGLSNTCQQTCATDPLNPQAECGFQCVYDPGSQRCAEWCAASNDQTSLCGHVRTAPAKSSDIDADGKADLIAYGRDGAWYVDRSSVNLTNSADGFGAWDLVLLGAAPAADERVFPVVADYDVDGQVDLATYNSDTGVWRVMWSRSIWKTTKNAIFGDVRWDHNVDFSQTDPQIWEAGARPFAVDADGYREVMGQSAGAYKIGQTVDLILYTPAGKYLSLLHRTAIKSVNSYFNGQKNATGITKYALSSGQRNAINAAGIDQTVQLVDGYLDDGDLLAKAPAWAFSPVVQGIDGSDAKFQGDFIKYPDGIPYGNLIDAPIGEITDGNLDGQMFIVGVDDNTEPTSATSDAKILALDQQAPGQNFTEPLAALYEQDGGWSAWRLWDEQGNLDVELALPSGFGNAYCEPITADFDGDNVTDRATLCPNGEWHVAYSSDAMALRTIQLAGSPAEALPARVATGGVAYQDLIAKFAPYHYGCAGAQAAQCTIFNLPVPTGPYFASCMAKNPANPMECLSQ